MSLTKFKKVKFKKVFEINISENNLSYKSDFTEAETVFWLEAVRNLIIKKSFENTK